MRTTRTTRHWWGTGVVMLALLGVLAGCGGTGVASVTPAVTALAATMSAPATGAPTAASTAVPAPAAPMATTAPSVASAMPAASTGAGMRTVTDMAGRQVALPAQINKIATIGAVPVINSLVFAFGDGDKIVNGLPDFARKPQWKYQTIFDPRIANEPQLQDANNAPNIEEVLKAAPDVVLTLDRPTVDTLGQRGIPAIYLAWQTDNLKQAMTILGQVLNKPAQADAYTKYFDTTLARVNNVIGTVPMESRPKVLYVNLKTLSQPQLIGEWWIRQAGGISVTDNGRMTESITFSAEQVLAWNPDIVIVSDPADVEGIKADPRFKTLKAVMSGKVYLAPIGAHLWANRTIEQPLGVLWAAKLFYPERFTDVDLTGETKSFYHTFFGFDLSDAQVAEILSGKF